MVSEKPRGYYLGKVSPLFSGTLICSPTGLNFYHSLYGINKLLETIDLLDLSKLIGSVDWESVEWETICRDSIKSTVAFGLEFCISIKIKVRRSITSVSVISLENFSSVDTPMVESMRTSFINLLHDMWVYRRDSKEESYPEGYLVEMFRAFDPSLIANLASKSPGENLSLLGSPGWDVPAFTDLIKEGVRTSWGRICPNTQSP